MSTIEKVDFQGDELQAVRDERGVWVVVRRVCEALGPDVDGQRRKLQGKPWAVTEMKSATGPDGKTYEVFALHLDSLPMWLATIEPSRVRPEVRAKLERYQVECARVLRDHFFGRQPVAAPLVPATVDVNVVAAIVEVVERRLAMTELSIVARIEQRFEALERRLNAVSNETLGGTIGRGGAGRIRSGLRHYADLYTGEPRKTSAWKSRLKKADNELRGAVGHSVRAWGLLPVAKEGDATGRLADMLRIATDVAEQRAAAKQTSIPFDNSNVVPFAKNA